MDILTTTRHSIDQPRKLSLKKETLRELTSSELRQVAGGSLSLNPSGGSIISSGTSVISSGTSVIAPSTSAYLGH